MGQLYKTEEEEIKDNCSSVDTADSKKKKITNNVWQSSRDLWLYYIDKARVLNLVTWCFNMEDIILQRPIT